VYRRNRRLVAFDMDSTLIQTEVIDQLALAAGVGEEVFAITEAAMNGELDFKESLLRRVALLEGLEEGVLAEIAANLPLTPGADRLIRTLRTLGYKTAILSGGFSFSGEALRRRLGIDFVFANGDTWWHRDQDVPCEVGIKFIYYLGEPLTADRGALCVIPGSHLQAEFNLDIPESMHKEALPSSALGDDTLAATMQRLQGLLVSTYSKRSLC